LVYFIALSTFQQYMASMFRYMVNNEWDTDRKQSIVAYALGNWRNPR